MNSRLILAVLAIGSAGVALADFEEVRELAIESRGIERLDIDAGAGSLDVAGVPGAASIRVTATIRVDADDEKAQRRIESDMTLSLEKDGDTALLKSWFDSGAFSWGDGAVIHLKVEMPDSLQLVVDDGSGSIEIDGVHGNIRIDDGSGSLEMADVGGEVDIEDGSGSITVTGVGGNISINDGSGSIKVRNVSGSVTIDDGSGSIDVSDVDEDLIIVDDGSGSLDFSNIGGRIQKET